MYKCIVYLLSIINDLCKYNITDKVLIYILNIIDNDDIKLFSNILVLLVRLAKSTHFLHKHNII